MYTTQTHILSLQIQILMNKGSHQLIKLINLQTALIDTLTVDEQVAIRIRIQEYNAAYKKVNY